MGNQHKSLTLALLVFLLFSTSLLFFVFHLLVLTCYLLVLLPFLNLIALFGASSSSLAVPSQVKQASMANVASSSTSASVPMSGIDLSHSVFSAQVINRRAYDMCTWVFDIGATNHFVCSVDLLT